jgi:hypothetical protein
MRKARRDAGPFSWRLFDLVPRREIIAAPFAVMTRPQAESESSATENNDQE